MIEEKEPSQELISSISKGDMLKKRRRNREEKQGKGRRWKRKEKRKIMMDRGRETIVVRAGDAGGMERSSNESSVMKKV